MIIAVTEDRQEILSVLLHPSIFPLISDDKSSDPKKFVLPIDAIYLACYINGNIAGISVFHDVFGWLKFHPNMLPKYRKHAHEFVRLSIEIGKSINKRLFVSIPALYPRLIRFAYAMGFASVGRLKKDIQKDGKLYDVEVMRLV